MLALKHMVRRGGGSSSKSIRDLPIEIVALILQFLHTGPRGLSDISSISLTCHTLRRAALPILFADLHLTVFEHRLTQRSRWILTCLQRAGIDIVQHIRHLTEHVSFHDEAIMRPGKLPTSYPSESVKDQNRDDSPIHGSEIHRTCCSSSLSDVDLILACKLDSVQVLTLACIDSPLAILLRPLELPRLQAVHIRIVSLGCIKVAFARYSDVFGAKPFNTCQLTLDLPLSPQDSGYLTYLSRFIKDHGENIVAAPWSVLAEAKQVTSDHPQRHFMLEELHVGVASTYVRSDMPPAPNSSSMLNDFESLRDLGRLRRLSVKGCEECDFILRATSELPNLEALRLETRQESLFHRHVRNHGFEGLPYLKLSNLRSLSLRYVSTYLSIKHVLPAQLRHFRIEYLSGQMTSYDLQWVAKRAPQLTCLELDIGALTNLWHPTAIAGVDVDIEVYGRLNALKSFLNLRTLRLFPTYIRNTAHSPVFQQPVSDEQAVKIYHYLHAGCSKFQDLIISISGRAYLEHVTLLRHCEPMRWWVFSSGPKTFLRTHQIGKRYELEQIWDGLRRLTMRTVRHLYRRRHFDELDSTWMIPSYELPGDFAFC